MKTYKKIIVICLFFMLALSFCGCSGNEGKEKTNSGTSADGKGNKNGSVDEERKQEDGNSRMKVGQKGIENVKHGDVVIFGEYEQDNDTSNGKEPIEWIVLYADATNEKVLLLSKYGLDVKGYDDKVQDATTWETCSLRSWLNDEFYNTAFSSEDKSYVIKTLLKNPDNTTMLTEGGNDTEDNVFLLSLEESLNEQYGFVSNHEKDDMLKRCAPTDYAIAQGAYKNNFVKTDEEKPACLWWLRTPGGNQRQACYADYGGIVRLGGFNVDGDFASYNDDTGKEDDLGSYKDTHDIVVRPALYVKVENLKENSSGNGV